VQKLFIRILYNIGNHPNRWGRLVLLGIAALIVVLLLHSTSWLFLAYYRVFTDDPDRGANVIALDSFGDKFSKVVYLDQGWTPADSLWFYNITQGADFVPYDMFLALEQANSAAKADKE
jgi:hypothetical protein